MQDTKITKSARKVYSVLKEKVDLLLGGESSFKTTNKTTDSTKNASHNNNKGSTDKEIGKKPKHNKSFNLDSESVPKDSKKSKNKNK